MERYQATETLRQFLLTHGLPHTDLTLFGLRCPYCGKSDRIRPLEPPGNGDLSMSEEDRSGYEALWRQLAPPGMGLGVCKFCQNPLALGSAGDARSLLPE